MNRTPRLTKLALLLSCIGFQTVSLPAFSADSPRLFVWGLGGSAGIARVDALLPLFTDPCKAVFYNDIQAELGTDDSWYGGAGLGYRAVTAPGLLGVYAFLDRNFSEEHNAFYVLNPGFELFHCNGFDFRFNGYLPMSEYKKRGPIFTPNVHDTCGVNVNTDQSIFIGHQQFVDRLRTTEEVGPGVDAELGFHILPGYDVSVFGGAYYYHLKDEADVKGVEARAIVPIKCNLALTVEAAYDNQQHGAIVGGIRVQLGHEPHRPVRMSDRLYDPIVRNIGTVKKGSGIPIIKRRQSAGLELIRDNIFFFSETGGATFTGTGSGTFEHPLANDQFTQTTVDGIDAIAPNANLFFNTGTYVIAAAPNETLNLPGGQSLFGRTTDFRNSAIVAQRPELLGGLNLLEGNNTIDSLVITNAVTNPVDPLGLYTLNIEDAPNVFLCNDVINTLALIVGDNTLPLTNLNGIVANNSSVEIHDTAINVGISVTGTNLGVIELTGIGNSDNQTVNNVFRLDDSEINVFADIASNDNLLFLAGIGNTGVGFTDNFANNTFTLTNTFIDTDVRVTGNNTSTIANTGIGGIAQLAAVTNFNDNTFLLANSNVTSGITVDGVSANAFVTGIGGITISNGTSQFNTNDFTVNDSAISASTIVGLGAIQNIATGIGGISESGSASFTDNIFNLNNSSVLANASSNINNGVMGAIGLGGYNATFEDNIFNLALSEIAASAQASSNTNINAANAMGTIATNIRTANFVGNVITSTDTEFTAQANVSNNAASNSAAGIGGIANDISTANFQDNILTLTGGSILSSATIATTNDDINFATGIGGNAGLDFSTANFLTNQITLINFQINATATTNINNARNFAAGIGGNSDDAGLAVFSGNALNVSGSTIESEAEAASLNNGANFATGVGGNSGSNVSNSNFTSNTFDFLNNSVVGTATTTTNAAQNFANGIGGNSFISVAAFLLNNGTFNSNAITGVASVTTNAGANFANAIGGNTFGGSSNFGSTNFTINGGSLTGQALIAGDNNDGLNAATGIGGVSAQILNSTFNVLDSTIDVLARVVDTNLNATNLAIGFEANNGTTITVTDSTGTITAEVGANVGVSVNNAQLALTTGTGVVNTPGSTFVVVVTP